MVHCPICRALLNGAETCRRCRAELKQVQEVERQGRALAGVAMHLLALGDAAGAMGVLRRASVVHATPEVRLLSMIVTTARRSSDALTETALPEESELCHGHDGQSGDTIDSSETDHLAARDESWHVRARE
jgi:hypothetical protein